MIKVSTVMINSNLIKPGVKIVLTTSQAESIKWGSNIFSDNL